MYRDKIFGQNGRLPFFSRKLNMTSRGGESVFEAQKTASATTVKRP